MVPDCFFFPFIVIGFLPGTVPPRINLLYPASLAAGRVCHKITKLDQWDAGRSVTWQLLGEGVEEGALSVKTGKRESASEADQLTPSLDGLM